VSNLLELESASLNNGITCDPETIIVVFRLHINITIAAYCFIILLTFTQPYSYKTYYQTLSRYIKTAMTKVILCYCMTTQEVKPVCNRHAVKLYRNIKKMINLQKVVTWMQEKKNYFQAQRLGAIIDM